MLPHTAPAFEEISASCITVKITSIHFQNYFSLWYHMTYSVVQRFVCYYLKCVQVLVAISLIYIWRILICWESLSILKVFPLKESVEQELTNIFCYSNLECNKTLFFFFFAWEILKMYSSPCMRSSSSLLLRVACPILSNQFLSPLSVSPFLETVISAMSHLPFKSKSSPWVPYTSPHPCNPFH